MRPGPEGRPRAGSTSSFAGRGRAACPCTCSGTVRVEASARRAVGVLLGLLAIPPFFPRRRGASTRAHISPPTCWLQCGQLLARHFDALLERPVPHHLPLDLVHRVNHRRVIPPPERLPDLDQL